MINKHSTMSTTTTIATTFDSGGSLVVRAEEASTITDSINSSRVPPAHECDDDYDRYDMKLVTSTTATSSSTTTGSNTNKTDNNNHNNNNNNSINDNDQTINTATAATTTSPPSLLPPLRLSLLTTNPITLFKQWFIHLPINLVKHTLSTMIVSPVSQLTSNVRHRCEHEWIPLLKQYAIYLMHAMICLIAFCVIFSASVLFSTIIIHVLFMSHKPLLYYRYPLHFIQSSSSLSSSSNDYAAAGASSSSASSPMSGNSLYSNLVIQQHSEAPLFKIMKQQVMDSVTFIEQVSIDFSIPENDLMMQHVGMFTVRMSLLQQKQQKSPPALSHNDATTTRTLFVSHMNCMLQYKSQLLRWMDALIFSPLYLINWRQQSQQKQLHMLVPDDKILIQQFNAALQQRENLADDGTTTTTILRVEISDNRAQFYSSHIHFNAHLIGWKYYTYHYRFILWCIILPIVLFCSCITSLVIVIIGAVILYTRAQQQKVLQPKRFARSGDRAKIGGLGKQQTQPQPPKRIHRAPKVTPSTSSDDAPSLARTHEGTSEEQQDNQSSRDAIATNNEADQHHQHDENAKILDSDQADQTTAKLHPTLRKRNK